VLDENPENKQKLMDLFEKMQDYGQPPAGITSVSFPGGMWLANLLDILIILLADNFGINKMILI